MSPEITNTSQKNSVFYQVFDKEWKMNLLLFVCSFSIYLFYFSHVFFNINSVLAGITGDALKNYYTYSYHIKNDEGVLHFSGMNFPFGEHVVFTDCQPILTFILRLLPFTHSYLIGILHSLLFLSYIFTPIILFKIFRRFNIDQFSSFFFSLGITLLSPQFAKIAGGHHGLAYGCMIPLSILFILNFLHRFSKKNLVILFIFNFLLFLLHPYMGFSTSVFSFLAISLNALFKWNKTTVLKDLFKAFLAGLLPLICFKIFMKLTDQHPGRTVEPAGGKTLVENIDSLLAPDFGPFKTLLEGIFTHKTIHLEGHSYLGLITILLTTLFVVSLPFLYKRFHFKKEFLAILIASLFLLLLSFGLHVRIFGLLHVKSASINQFRANCRFAWFFYYALPLFVIPALYHAFRSFSFSMRSRLFPAIALLLFVFNFWEANYYFRKDEANFWKFRNILSEDFLNPEEKEIIAHIHASKTQAILPLPMFALGSEMYDRIGADLSMIPSMLYSYHTGVPIVGGAMSRTSIPETAESIELLNSYKKNNPGIRKLDEFPFLIIKTRDPLLADEDRLLTAVKMFHKNDSLEFGEIGRKQLSERKLDRRMYVAHGKVDADSNLIYIPFENKKPFLPSRMLDYENIYTLDSNKIKSGLYIMSFHYHYTEKVYTSLDVTLIVTKTKGPQSDWKYFQRVSVLSGFYPGFAIMEYKVQLEKDSRYEFILKGMQEKEYKISHFMLRPEHTSIITREDNDSLFNNFPD